MNQDTTGYDVDLLREYIARCDWKWARTMVDVPHEYIYRGRCPLTDKEFFYVLKAQVYHGVNERWGKYVHPYLYIDGYKYWTMGDYSPENRTMNRQKIFDEFKNLENPAPEYYEPRQARIIAGAIKQFGEVNVFEIGCGDGRFLDILAADPSRYYGVDPCSALVKKLKASRQGFYMRATAKAFEETKAKWGGLQGVIIGVFGSPSYVMHQYLRMIPEGQAGYFLMFYKEDFCPEPFKAMHHFNYKASDLQEMFPRAYINPCGDYYVVSSQQIDWHRAQMNGVEQMSLFE